MKSVALVGMSHTEAIAAAYGEEGRQSIWAHMTAVESGSTYRRDGTTYILEDVLVSRLERATTICDVAVSTIGGNLHNSLFMMEVGGPIDFISPDLDKPLNPDATILPYGTLKKRLSAILEVQDMKLFDLVTDSYKISCHVESPPPPRDSDFVKRHVGTIFRVKYPDAKVADPWLRLKIWMLHSNFYKERCAAKDVIFVPRPDDAVDADGFLKEEYADTRSATHANIAYGKLVLKQIEEILG